MQSWKISFSGREGEKPEVFLQNLEDCKNSLRLSTDKILCALPSIFGDDVRDWFRGEKENIGGSWKRFKKEFRKEYVVATDDDDILDELRARTQTPGEKISSFVSKFLAIMKRFKKPMSGDKLVRLAYKNLFPDCRKYVRELCCKPRWMTKRR